MLSCNFLFNLNVILHMNLVWLDKMNASFECESIHFAIRGLVRWDKNSLRLGGSTRGEGRLTTRQSFILDAYVSCWLSAALKEVVAVGKRDHCNAVVQRRLTFFSQRNQLPSTTDQKKSTIFDKTYFMWPRFRVLFFSVRDPRGRWYNWF